MAKWKQYPPDMLHTGALTFHQALVYKTETDYVSLNVYEYSVDRFRENLPPPHALDMEIVISEGISPTKTWLTMTLYPFEGGRTAFEPKPFEEAARIVLDRLLPGVITWE